LFGSLVLALACAFLPACSSGDDAGDDDTSSESAAASDDLSAEEQEVVDAAQAWVDDEADLEDEQKDQLQFTGITSTPAVSNVTFSQFIDDHQVIGGELVVHVLEDGTVQGASNALTEAEPADDVDPIDESEAEENAGKATDGTPDEIGPTELVWVQSGSELVLAYSVHVTATEPDGSFTVMVNAESGDVISIDDSMADRAVRGRYAPWSSRRTPLTVLPAAMRRQDGGDACDPGDAPSACLFIPDPIYANGGDPPEVADADAVLQGRELEGLDDSSGHLIGEYVDTEGAATDVEPAVETDGTWAAGRAHPGFEAAMAYYWVDRAHRLMDEVGFGDVWGSPIPVEPVDSETVDNAFWDGQAIHLGVGSDGINEGEDASGIVHEYGHAVLDFQNPSLFDSPEGGAYHEGFGDLLALLTTLDDRTGDIGCLFPWTESLECLRRLDTDLVYPDDLVNEVHGDGMIYTGAIWDILEGLLDNEGLSIEDCPGTEDCDEVRDRILTTLLTSHGYLVSGTTLSDVAAAFEQANDAVTGGEDADLIDEAFAAHGLTGGGTGTMDPDGGIDEPAEGVPSVGFEISHTYRGDLDVVVGVADADGNDLCEPVSLHTPDQSDAEDNLTGLIDLSDSDCGGLMPPSGDQQWYLRAVDTLQADTGEILSFTVYDGTDPYDAPGLPLPIADNDPAGTTAIVDGSGEGTDSPDLPDDSEGDGPSFDIEITHSYVGDLSIRAGTADNDGGNVLCSVEVLDPDPGNAGDGGLSGSIDMSDCADQYPPSDDSRWFVQVIDTAAVDEGTVDSLTLNGPDGESIEFTDLPADIPDDDPSGLVLLTDGERAQPTSSAGGDGAQLQISVDHPYAGDLSVEIGAVDADDNVLCQEAIATPDSSNSEVGLEIDQPLEDCAGYFPPSEDVRFYLFIADTLAQDEGSLVSATLTGPDGDTYQTDTGAIPDADPEGVTTFFQPA
jgi:subtilisin-like proprotein convertase family protein